MAHTHHPHDGWVDAPTDAMEEDVPLEAFRLVRAVPRRANAAHAARRAAPPRRGGSAQPLPAPVDAQAAASALDGAAEKAALLASYPPLQPGEPESWRLARARVGDAVRAALVARMESAIAAADAPAFEGVARFVLDRATPQTPLPDAPRPPDTVPAALAVAGGANQVDHGATVRRLAADLRRRGVAVAALGPADLDARAGGGVAAALRSILRQVSGGSADGGDDVAAIVAWHADEWAARARGRRSGVHPAAPPPPANSLAAAEKAAAARAAAWEARRAAALDAIAKAGTERTRRLAEEAARGVEAELVAEAAASQPLPLPEGGRASARPASPGPAPGPSQHAPRPDPAADALPPLPRDAAVADPAAAPPLAVVVEAVEACDAAVLGDLLRVLAWARSPGPTPAMPPPDGHSLETGWPAVQPARPLPVVAVLGVATSAVAAEAALARRARRCLDPARFRLARTAVRAEAALAAVLAGGSFPGIALSARVGAALDDRFLDADFTAAGLVRGLDAVAGEHFRAGSWLAGLAATAVAEGGRGGLDPSYLLMGRGRDPTGVWAAVAAAGGAAGGDAQPTTAGAPAADGTPAGRLTALLAALPRGCHAAASASLGLSGAFDPAKAAVAVASSMRAWAAWAATLRWVSAAARAVGLATPGSGLTLRELVRDAAAPGYLAPTGAGGPAVAALFARVARGPARTGAAPASAEVMEAELRAVLAALPPAADAVEGGKEALAPLLDRATELRARLGEGGGAVEAAGPASSPAPHRVPPCQHQPPPQATPAAPAAAAAVRGTAARRSVLQRVGTDAAAALPAASGGPLAAAVSALLADAVAAIATTPPHALPAFSQFVARPAGGGAVVATLSAAPRLAVHTALSAPDTYLGGGGGGTKRGRAAAAAAAAASAGSTAGADDASILYRLLLQADEAPPAADLLAQFARAHGHEVVTDQAAAAAVQVTGGSRGRKAARRGGPGVFLAPGAEVPAAEEPVPPPPPSDRPAPTPIPEVIARFNRALGELHMAGIVGRARRPGTLRRAVFPAPAGL